MTFLTCLTPDSHPAAVQVPQCYLAMAQAAAGMGNIEVAYCLYAKGYSACLSPYQQLQQQQHHGQLQQALPSLNSPPAVDLVQQLSAGRLHMLHMLCSTPTAVRPLNCNRWSQMQQQFFAQPVMSSSAVQGRFTSSLTSSNISAGSSNDFTQWWCTASCSTSISNSSSGGISISGSSNSSHRPARVFCVSDLHVDQSAGANLQWVQRISTSSFKNDVLIVAGMQPTVV
jgi:hypothetical protein